MSTRLSVPFSRRPTRLRVRIALTCNHAAEQIPYHTQATRTQTAAPQCGTVDGLCETNACNLIRQGTGRMRGAYL